MARTANEVAHRIAALGAVIWRAQFENHLLQASAPADEVAQGHARMLAWVAGTGIALSPAERASLDRPLGDWSPEEIGQHVWRFEAAVPLLWAIGRFDDMPGWTAPVAATELAAHLPMGQAVAPTPVTQPARRVERAFHTAEFFNWRARNEMMRRAEVAPPAGETYEATVGRAIQSALAQGLVAPDDVSSGDLQVQGRPYVDLDAQGFAQAAALAQERHQALGWLVGTADWDDVDTAT